MHADRALVIALNWLIKISAKNLFAKVKVAFSIPAFAPVVA